MNKEDFTRQIVMLHDFYAVDSSRDLIQQKIKLWWERWIEVFPNKDLRYLISAAKIAKDNHERVPSWAEFKNIVSNVKLQNSESSTEKTDCEKCYGLGVISAMKHEGSMVYSCFRCQYCQNWRDEMSESVPLYGQEWFEKGYVQKRYSTEIQINKNIKEMQDTVLKDI